MYNLIVMSRYAINEMRNADMNETQIAYCLMEIYAASLFIERQRLEEFKRKQSFPTVLNIKELLQEWAPKDYGF